MVISLHFFLSIGAGAQQNKPFVLLPENEAKQVKQLCSREAPANIDGSWQPSDADVAKLEKDISHLSNLRAPGSIEGYQVLHPRKYFRQYVGLSIAGHRYIYVNGICESVVSPQWREKLQDVCDGGCYWGALYDPMTGRFSDLQVNGIG
jgi:hypothetical protein